VSITNFRAAVSGGNVSCTWDSTLAFSFLYQDAEMIFSTVGNSWSGPRVEGAVYQAVDSATASPTPDPSEPVPQRHLTLFWNDDPTAIKYEVIIDGSSTFITGGELTYSHKSNRLESGVRTFGIIAIDSAGNRSTIDNLTYEIEVIPPPVEGMSLSQSGAGNITLTLVPPSGW